MLSSSTFTTTSNTTSTPLLQPHIYPFGGDSSEFNFTTTTTMFDPSRQTSNNFSSITSSFTLFTNTSNDTTTTLPLEFTQMTPRSRNVVIAYSILFIIAATGNLTVFFSVCHQLAKLKWRITVLMLHLSIADLIVTFFLMPLEICWRITIQWVGGEVLCKLCAFLRAFGLYLSSNILICISLDRFIAILFPLRMVGATRRVKAMIAVAWLAAAISSAPQCVVFTVKSHPKYKEFDQCVSFGFFSSPGQEIAYNVFSVSAMYFIPLIVTVFTYSMILWKISSKSRVLIKQQSRNVGGQDLQNSHNQNFNYNVRGGGMTYGNHQQNNPATTTQQSQNTTGNPTSQQQQQLLTSNNSSDSANLLARAKKRTLRMTMMIIIMFVVCWSPYAVITLWYSFDKEGAKQLDPSLQDVLFIMAVANSCVNPIVYGSYTKKTAGSIFNCNWAWTSFTCLRCCCCSPQAKDRGSRRPRRRLSLEDDPRTKNRTSSLLAITSVI